MLTETLNTLDASHGEVSSMCTRRLVMMLAVDFNWRIEESIKN